MNNSIPQHTHTFLRNRFRINIFRLALRILVCCCLFALHVSAQERFNERQDEADSSETLPLTTLDTVPKKHTETFRQPWQVETAGEYDVLTNGRAPWKHLYANLAYRFTRRMVVYGEARWQERFGLGDVNLKAGAYIPLTDQWYTIAEINLSPSAQTIPRLALLAQAHCEIFKAFFLNAGVRYGLFQDITLTMATLGSEYYFGDFRAAVRFNLGTTSLNETAWGANAQLSYYLIGGSSLTVGFALGRELVATDENTFRVFDVRYASLGGRQWITPQLGIVYEALWQHQGTAFDLFGGRGGICVRF